MKKKPKLFIVGEFPQQVKSQKGKNAKGVVPLSLNKTWGKTNGTVVGFSGP